MTASGVAACLSRSGVVGSACIVQRMLRGLASPVSLTMKRVCRGSTLASRQHGVTVEPTRLVGNKLSRPFQHTGFWTPHHRTGVVS